MSNHLRNAIVGAMLLALPVSGTVAATRPSAAVPAAASSVAAQDRMDGVDNTWLWVGGGLVLAIILGVILFSGDDDDQKEFSQG